MATNSYFRVSTVLRQLLKMNDILSLRYLSFRLPVDNAPVKRSLVPG